MAMAAHDGYQKGSAQSGFLPDFRDKVKQIVRRWQRFACTGGYSSPLVESKVRMQDWRNIRKAEAEISEAADAPVPEGSLAVYVGRERRRYILCDQYVNHPLFKSLVARSQQHDQLQQESSSSSSSLSSDSSSPNSSLLLNREGISIPCEVVLFEHLLWILRNDDSAAVRESVDELVEFYACS